MFVGICHCVSKGGGRTGASGSTKRSRKRRLTDVDNSTCAQWDDDGRNIVPITVKIDPRNYRVRGYSLGGFGTYPATPDVVRISGNL